ncbi:MAG: ethanolamine ammonia-lyase subunit EutC [Aeromicrobium sp.]
MTAFWDPLRAATPSRIGQARTGDTVSVHDVLAFREAHARARDAVHVPLDVEALVSEVAALGLGEPAVVSSAAGSRAEYLRRPDLGRQLAADASVPSGAGADVGIVLADGLSTTAVSAHGAAMVAALADVFRDRLTLAAPVIATNARVALGDAVGEQLGVTTLVVLIGERPGLSVDDSLGIYLTHHPRRGRRDSERNCVSNVHPAGGLGYAAAARIVAALVDGARTLGESGVRLKDVSGALD